MIKKNTLILFFISLVLVIVFILIQQNDGFTQLRNYRETVTPTQSFWLNIQMSQISKITFKMAELNDVIIQRMNGTDWTVNNGNGSITPGKIEELFSELNAIQPLLILADPPKASAIGLDNPDKTLIFELSDSTLISLQFGSINPLQTGYYAQNDSREVVLISKGSVDNIVNIFLTSLAVPELENGS